MKKKYNKGVVVLSGGQDSVTCLGVALSECSEVVAIGFDYGQRHKVELECAKHLCALENVPYHIVEVSALKQLVTSALIGEGNVSDAHAYKPGLPASFVPARNALFLTLSHALAQEVRAGVIYTGVCQTDYSGYPDCRQTFVDNFAKALNIGYESSILILTPLMNLTKAQTFELAAEVGYLDKVLEHSHTCYEGNHTDRHAWGYGCANCPSCVLRKLGYEAFIENF